MGTNLKLPLILGMVVAAIAAAVLCAAFGRAHLATGTVMGICIAYLGFLLYMLLMPRSGGKGFSFVKNYLPGAAVRYAVMIGAFCAVVFWLRINTLGVLLGTFIGMMVSTFVSLSSMRQAATKPPEA
jgi:hypothetical protein